MIYGKKFRGKSENFALTSLCNRLLIQMIFLCHNETWSHNIFINKCNISTQQNYRNLWHVWSYRIFFNRNFVYYLDNPDWLVNSGFSLRCVYTSWTHENRAGRVIFETRESLGRVRIVSPESQTHRFALEIHDLRHCWQETKPEVDVEKFTWCVD